MTPTSRDSKLPATPAGVQTSMSAQQARLEREAIELRADTLTKAHRDRKARGQKHPVEDFLHTYYPFSPAQLRRWHPGWWVAYERDADTSRAGVGDVSADATRRWYRDFTEHEAGTRYDMRQADVSAFLEARGDAVAWIYRLLAHSTLDAKPGNFSCFGLHEWAMVYKLRPGEKRHESLPLRLGQEETDRIVESNKLVCSHIDAFRFFTSAARPRNSSQPTRATQTQRDDPACLHVGMDLYKWAMKLVPLIPSELALDCFEHAHAIRVLDMEASPYDCRSLGYGVVPIETDEGKREYVRRQRELADHSNTLRERMLGILEPLTPLFPVVG